MIDQQPLVPLANNAVWLSSAAWGQRPRIARLRYGVGAGLMQHSEWGALLARFVQDCAVDYGTMTRVRRLVEVYLQRPAEADPDVFADSDDQLAFYLNAYNAIAIHQILLHYPVESIREIPQVFTRPYPIGRRNLSLHMLHANILRAFGDPRIHLAISNGARGAAVLQPEAFTGNTLQAQLDAALRRFVADSERGLRFDSDSNTLYLSPLLRWFAGDIVQPHRMPSLAGLIRSWTNPQALMSLLQPYLPAALVASTRDRQLTVHTLPFDWRLNRR